MDSDDERFLPAAKDDGEVQTRSLLLVALAAQLESTESERSSRVCLTWHERVSSTCSAAADCYFDNTTRIAPLLR